MELMRKRNMASISKKSFMLIFHWEKEADYY